MSYIMQTGATPSTCGFQYRASAPKNPRSRRELLYDLVRAAFAASSEILPRSPSRIALNKPLSLGSWRRLDECLYAV